MSDVDYKVALDIYNGPLDLLLYLIKKNEVDIFDIPICEITEQYLEYLNLFEKLDINIAGEFLVMAATLMLIKSRMLLPKEELLRQEDEEDPRLALVRQLIEYKRFKDAAHELYDRAEFQSMKYVPSSFCESPGQDGDGELLKEVDLWDLIGAFKKILRETGIGLSQTIINDDIPIEVYIRNLLERLKGNKLVSFFELFKNQKDRINIIGTFLAILELTRTGRIVIEQNQLFGDIYVSRREDVAA